MCFITIKHYTSSACGHIMFTRDGCEIENPLLCENEYTASDLIFKIVDRGRCNICKTRDPEERDWQAIEEGFKTAAQRDNQYRDNYKLRAKYRKKLFASHTRYRGNLKNIADIQKMNIDAEKKDEMIKKERDFIEEENRKRKRLLNKYWKADAHLRRAQSSETHVLFNPDLRTRSPEMAQLVSEGPIAPEPVLEAGLVVEDDDSDDSDEEGSPEEINDEELVAIEGILETDEEALLGSLGKRLHDEEQSKPDKTDDDIQLDEIVVESVEKHSSECDIACNCLLIGPGIMSKLQIDRRRAN